MIQPNYVIINNEKQNSIVQKQDSNAMDGRSVSKNAEKHTKLDHVGQRKLSRTPSLSHKAPLMGQGGWMSDFFSEIADIAEEFAHKYCEMGSGKSYISKYQVKNKFENILNEKDLSKIKQLVAKYGIEEVRKVVDHSAFIHNAAEKGNFILVRYLVDDLECDPNVRHNGDSPLIGAVENSHIDIVKFLISRSSPESFRDDSPFRSGLINHAEFKDQPTDVTSLLVDLRDRYPVPISGCLSAAVYLVGINREKVVNWLNRDLKIPTKMDEPIANIIVKVVEAANAKEAEALISAVKKNDPVLVDILVATGALPDQTDKKGDKPIHLAKHPLIVRRLYEAQQMHDSFRNRQLEHLLKDFQSTTMDQSDEVFSWSNLIAAIEETPMPQRELLDFSAALRKSLALRFISKNRYLSNKQKSHFFQEALASLKVGEWIILNDPDCGKHHTATLVEKREGGRFLCINANRYRMGSHRNQMGDKRVITNSVEKVIHHCIGMKNVIDYYDDRDSEYFRLDGKIMKGWQGAENNCVTQSDTVLFEYALAEKLGISKFDLYRQIKPLRVHFLSSKLKEQREGKRPKQAIKTKGKGKGKGKGKSSVEARHISKGTYKNSEKITDWFNRKWRQNHRYLCPLILAPEALDLYYPQDLLKKGLDRFITQNMTSGVLSLWEKGSDAPTRTAPWQQWKTLVKGVPRASSDPTRQVYIKKIQRLTEPGMHLTFSINDKNIATFTCDLFNPSIRVKCHVTAAGSFVFEDTNGGFTKEYKGFHSMWSALPEILAKAALRKECEPDQSIIRSWARDVVKTAYKTSYDTHYRTAGRRGSMSQQRPAMGDDWKHFEKQIVDALEQRWTDKDHKVIMNLLGFSAPSLVESRKDRQELSSLTRVTIDVIASKGVPYTEVKGALWFKKYTYKMLLEASELSPSFILDTLSFGLNRNV